MRSAAGAAARSRHEASFSFARRCRSSRCSACAALVCSLPHGAPRRRRWLARQWRRLARRRYTADIAATTTAGIRLLLACLARRSASYRLLRWLLPRLLPVLPPYYDGYHDRRRPRLSTARRSRVRRASASRCRRRRPHRSRSSIPGTARAPKRLSPIGASAIAGRRHKTVPWPMPASSSARPSPAWKGAATRSGRRRLTARTRGCRRARVIDCACGAAARRRPRSITAAGINHVRRRALRAATRSAGDAPALGAA